MSETSNQLDDINEQHMSDLFDDMGIQHQHIDVEQHLAILFSSYPEFLPLYKNCLTSSCMPKSKKYFYNHAHRALMLRNFLLHTLKFESTAWVDCGFMDGFSSRLICSIIKQMKPGFLGKNYYHLSFPRKEVNVVGHDLMMKIDVNTKELTYSHGDIQEENLLLSQDPALDVIDTAFLDEFPETVECNGLTDKFLSLSKEISFSFIHLDVSTYRLTTDLINLFIPRLNCNGVIMLSNYGNPYFPGPREAWESYFNKQQIPYAILDCGSAVYLKRQ